MEKGSVEWWDVYDEKGNFLGQRERGLLPEGEYHHMVSIFVANGEGELLLTRRAPQKSYAGQWEVTAGSVLASESLVHAAKRELEEETGITCRASDLAYLGRWFCRPMGGWMSCFFLFWEGDLEQIRLQEGETDGVRWVALSPDLWEDETLADPVRKRLLLFWRDLVALSDRSQFSPWLGWAQELQSLAQQGLAYTKDPYDRERFVRLSEIAVEMLQEKSGCTKERIAGLFANETGYQTPKLEVRAAVFRDGKILLVQERGNRRWSLPGGWCDIGLGIGANAAKECREEAGVIVHPQRLIALENRAEHDYTPYVHHIIKCYVLCEEDAAGAFIPNTETLDARFFSEDDLPPLALDRVTPRSLQMCFAAARDENRLIYFD